jgi:hypothetical protein
MFLKLTPLALVVLLAVPHAADAEQRGRGRQPQQPAPTRSPRAEALAPPPHLAQALLPAGARRTNERFLMTNDGRWWDRSREAKSHRGWWKHQPPSGSFYAVPYTGGYGYYESAPQEEERSAPPPSVATYKGLLQFEITPSSGLDYYIDGVHVGSSSSLGSEFEVNAGARQIEVRARGYKPATFDRRIEEGRVTTVRASLDRMEEPPAPRHSAARVMYVIPGCYMGNARPVASALPAGCDIKKMVTRPGL